jgi:hypothetical protein
MLLVPLPLACLCWASGYPVLAFAVFAIGVWPFPFRCGATERGLEVSWLWVRAWIPWECVRDVHLVLDPRRWVVGKRKIVLQIARKGSRIVTIFGTRSVLERIASEVSAWTAGRELARSAETQGELTRV